MQRIMGCKIHCHLSLCLLFLIAVIGSVHAQTTVVLNAVKDNTLYESTTGMLSNGIGENLFTGRTSSGTNPDFLKRRALLKFDFSSIPAGSTITSVSLVLNMNRTTNTAALISTVHTVSADWGEGNSNAGGQEGTGITPQTNDATWVHRFFNTATWVTRGGDFNPTPSASINVANVGSYTWTSSQLVADVQNWLNNPSSNFGWIILGNETSTHTAKRFASRENPTAAARPRLSITYTAPCVAPTIDSFVASSSNVCPGGSSQLTVTGSLNNAAAWHLYTGTCGGKPIASNATGVFNVSPLVTTAYYVRGEGGCILPGSCSNLTVTVLPDDDPSFNYSAAIFCRNDNDPAPVIAGTQGGVFSVNPAGLAFSPITGVIDLSASTSGDFTITYTTTGDCPASSEVSITVVDVIEISEQVEICNGENFQLGTQTLAEAGVYEETFQSVSGCDSIVTLTLLVNPLYNRQETRSICNGENFSFGTQNLSLAGEYTEIFQSAAGCDSTVVLTLQVNEVDVRVTQTDLTLNALATEATFQWVDCNDNNNPILNETNNSFIPAESGSFAVLVTMNGCTDMSECFDIVVVGVEHDPENQWYIYPNPVKDKVMIKLGSRIDARVELLNLQGQSIKVIQVNGNTLEMNLLDVEHGLYLMRVQSPGLSKTFKIYKE